MISLILSFSILFSSLSSFCFSFRRFSSFSIFCLSKIFFWFWSFSSFSIFTLLIASAFAILKFSIFFSILLKKLSIFLSTIEILILKFKFIIDLNLSWNLTNENNILPFLLCVTRVFFFFDFCLKILFFKILFFLFYIFF